MNKNSSPSLTLIICIFYFILCNSKKKKGQYPVCFMAMMMSVGGHWGQNALQTLIPLITPAAVAWDSY